jgi:hypothetical protein
MQTENRVRRAGMYLAVLLTSMLVAIIGMSALSAVRVQMRSAEGDNDVTASRLCAQSAAEVGFFTVRNDATWRTKYTHDTWVPAQALGPGAFTWKLIDERNGDLAADDKAPVLLYGQATFGEAVRTYSVLLEPGYLDQTNWIKNPGFVEGTAYWTSGGDCALELDAIDPHDPNTYLLVKTRSGAAAGPRQYLDTPPESGDSYDTEVWVKMNEYAEEAEIVLWVDTDLGSVRFSSDPVPVDMTWTQVSWTFTPTWSGELIEAYWSVVTTWSDQEFNIDNVVLHRAWEDSNMDVVTGTWQRVVDESD